jgi:hypothetical protein
LRHAESPKARIQSGLKKRKTMMIIQTLESHAVMKHR